MQNPIQHMLCQEFDTLQEVSRLKFVDPRTFKRRSKGGGAKQRSTAFLQCGSGTATPVDTGALF